MVAGGFLLNSINVLGKMAPKILKIGIIGCGDRGRGLIQVINQLPDQFSVTALCDIQESHLADARRLCKLSQPKSYQRHQELLADHQLDAVVVATPLYLHYPIAVDVLQSGKHLFLEKTMTYTIHEALNLVKLAKSKPRQIVQVGHQYRNSPLYHKVKEMITSNYLGDITQIECRWDRNNNWRRPVADPAMERQINWRMYKAYSGGLVAELLSHQIDFVNWAFDTRPKEIFATGGIDHFKDGRETFDNVQVMFRYEGKQSMVGNFGATCANSKDGFLFKIKGTLGTISLLTDEGMFYPEKNLPNNRAVVDGVSGATKIVWDKDGGTPILKERTKDGTWYAFQEFYNCIQNKTLPDSNVFTGARTAISVHLANKALYEKKGTHWKNEYNSF